jgi:hypothetical protein
MNSVGFRDVIQRRDAPGGCSLNVYCQTQNPNNPGGNQNDQNQFQQQCVSTISSHPTCSIPLTCNGQTTQCTGHLSGVQQNCRKYECISDSSFLKTD